MLVKLEILVEVTTEQLPSLGSMVKDQPVTQVTIHSGDGLIAVAGRYVGASQVMG